MLNQTSDPSIRFLNLHFGLRNFAQVLGDAFSSVYFYKLGISIPIIFLIWAGFFLVRFIVRPFYLKYAFGKNLKTILIISTILYSLSFPLLALIIHSSTYLILFIIYFALTDTIYWLVYHTYFTVLGDNTKRGQEVFYREALISFGRIVAPLIGAFLISTSGFKTAWFVSMVVAFFSATPLLFSQSVTIANPFNFSKDAIKETDKVGFWTYLFQSFYETAYYPTWILVLFIMLGDISLFGLILSIAVLFRVVVYYILGATMDHRRHYRLYFIGAGIMIAVVFVRAFFAYTIPIIILLDAILTLGVSTINPVIDVVTYNASKTSKNSLWFQFLSESGWDIGSMIAFVSIALMTYSGIELRYTMLIGVFGIIALIAVIDTYRKYHTQEKIPYTHAIHRR